MNELALFAVFQEQMLEMNRRTRVGGQSRAGVEAVLEIGREILATIELAQELGYNSFEVAVVDNIRAAILHIERRSELHVWP